MVSATATGPFFEPSLDLPVLLLVISAVFDHCYILSGDVPEHDWQIANLAPRAVA